MASISITVGDITRIEVDAIVNAANAELRGGGGVDGAIHRAAGPSVMDECRAIMSSRSPLRPGEVVSTGAGALPARFVLHTVGPIWGVEPPETQDAQLASCYRTSLDLAADLGCRSIAFPNISTGVYGFPKERAAGIAVRSVLDAPVDLDAVILVCFDHENAEFTRHAMERA